jgi:hypothetical protein
VAAATSIVYLKNINHKEVNLQILVQAHRQLKALALDASPLCSAWLYLISKFLPCFKKRVVISIIAAIDMIWNKHIGNLIIKCGRVYRLIFHSNLSYLA